MSNPLETLLDNGLDPYSEDNITTYKEFYTTTENSKKYKSKLELLPIELLEVVMDRNICEFLRYCIPSIEKVTIKNSKIAIEIVYKDRHPISLYNIYPVDENYNKIRASDIMEIPVIPISLQEYNSRKNYYDSSITEKIRSIISRNSDRLSYEEKEEAFLVDRSVRNNSYSNKTIVDLAHNLIGYDMEYVQRLVRGVPNKRFFNYIDYILEDDTMGIIKYFSIDSNGKRLYYDNRNNEGKVLRFCDAIDDEIIDKKIVSYWEAW